MNSMKLGLFIVLSVCVLTVYASSDVVMNYKKDATLDCSSLKGDDVEFFTKNASDVEIKISTGGKYTVDGKKLLITDLRGENINAKYYCKSGSEVLDFNALIGPYIYKPDKASQTATEGGVVEFKCTLLHGKPDLNPVKWEWTKGSEGNETVLENKENVKIEVSSSFNETVLKLSNVTDGDKGDYSCKVKNDYGAHSETIKLRVKDAYAALWPFLAILVEVFVLCAIILIYEKKCAKKNTNEDDNDQAQNLMGNKDGHASDVKKRTK